MQPCLSAVNVLIAIVSEIYVEVAETAEVEVRKLRARRIIDEEAAMWDSERRNPGYFPEFLEVLGRVTEPPEDVWAGVSGQISSVKGDVVGVKSDVGLKFSAMDEKVETKFSAMDEKVDKLAADMTEQMAAQTEQMAELKGMLQLLLENHHSV